MLLKSLYSKLDKLDVNPTVSICGSSLHIKFTLFETTFHCSSYNGSGNAEGFHIVCGYDIDNQETDRIWFDNFNRCLNFAKRC